jgi:hypothetical protein
VVGELQVHLKVVGSKFLIPPQDNQFPMATNLQPEKEDTDKGAKGGKNELKQQASNGNKQVYAVQGFDPKFRVVVGDLSKDGRWRDRVCEESRRQDGCDNTFSHPYVAWTFAEGKLRLNDALHKHDDWERRMAVLVTKLPDPEEGSKREIKEERPSQAGPGSLSQAREERAAKEPIPAERREKEVEVESKGGSTKAAPKPSVENEPPARRSSRPVKHHTNILLPPPSSSRPPRSCAAAVSP